MKKKKETKMASNVDKIVNGVLDQLRPIVKEAVQQADANARTELLAQFNKAIDGAGSAASAKPVAAKRKPGRPKKTESTGSDASSKESGESKASPKKGAVSDEVRKKLSDNLKKAREAKSDKVKPAVDSSSAVSDAPVKRKPGRPKKSETVVDVLVAPEAGVESSAQA